MKLIYIVIAAFALSTSACAQETGGSENSTSQTEETRSADYQEWSSVGYFGNESLLVTQGDTRFLFDPLFDNTFGVYQPVPDEHAQALLNGEGPFANIDAIFISHLHADHWSAEKVAAYLQKHKQTKLYLPAGGVDKLRSVVPEDDDLYARIVPVTLELNDPPQSFQLGEVKMDVVRVPHAGGARHAGVVNLIWRVTLGDGATIMHMGDATPEHEHYAAYAEHFAKLETDAAFPPYWLLVSEAGRAMMRDDLNALRSIGVHVPIGVPIALIESGAEYFSRPGHSIIVKESEGFVPLSAPPKPAE